MKKQAHPRNTGRVTLADVAREAGVSRNVVSLVLNNRLHPVIRYSEETAARIRETADRLGYRPNRSSRAHFGIFDLRFFVFDCTDQSKIENQEWDLGDVAQLGERRLCKPEVVGSSPIVSIVLVNS